MPDISFGTDGWRAIIAQGYTFDNVERVSRATAAWLATLSDSPSVVVGYDTRFLGAEFALHSARTLASAGIRVSSFALVEDYFYLGLVNFVEEMARVTQGVAAYCSADDLGKYVFDSFIGGRRQRKMSH